MCNKIIIYIDRGMVRYLKKIYLFITKTLICILIFLTLAILCRLNIDFKYYVYENIYQKYLDFSLIKDFYNKYLGGIFPIENISNSGVKPVFNENLFYYDITSYYDGVMLKVDYNYIIPNINNGLVVYIGKKDNYGNVVIVEGNNGIDIWYGNLCNTLVKLYDVLDSGDYLGEVCDNKAYIVYSKKNEFLNYVDYLN